MWGLTWSFEIMLCALGLEASLTVMLVVDVSKITSEAS